MRQHMNDSSTTLTKKLRDIVVPWLKQSPDCNCACLQTVFEEKKIWQPASNQASKSVTKFGAIAGNVAPAFIIELITVVRDVL